MRKHYPIITAQEARAIFAYCPDTGRLTYRSGTPWHAIGQEAGAVYGDGYRMVSVNGRCYRVARLIWLYMTGEWPRRTIDHINRVRDDDRWENLRDVSQRENTLNRGQRLPPLRLRKFIDRAKA